MTLIDPRGNDLSTPAAETQKMPEVEEIKSYTTAPKIDLSERIMDGILVGDKLIIEQYPVDAKTEGGLIKTKSDMEQSRTCEAWVVVKGTGVELDINVGDTVIFLAHAADAVPEYQKALKTGNPFFQIATEDITLILKGK